MEKLSIKDFEAELKLLDDRITIVPNPRRPGLANIKLGGVDICPIPDGYIQDVVTADYKYEFPNGMTAPHKTITQARVAVQGTLKLISTKEGEELFFDKE